MKLSIKQLKELIHESLEEMELSRPEVRDSGEMTRRLAESLKSVIREALETHEDVAVDECGSTEEAVVEELMEKKMDFKKLAKASALKKAKTLANKKKPTKKVADSKVAKKKAVAK